jgi:60 kDa SS-A/Ro ribonucleoprotein
MKSTQFVQQIIGDKKKKKTVEKIAPYLSKNEEPQDALVRIMLTGILKHQYYRTVDEQVKEAIPLILTASKKDPEFLLKAAAFARDNNMKGMVKLALACLSSNAKDDFLSDSFNRNAIISLLGTFHPGQLLQFVELCKSGSLGKGFGSRPQKWVRAVMESWKANKLEDYTLKYPTALNSLLRLVHPRYETSGRGKIVGYLLSNGKAAGKKQIAVEKLKKPNTKSSTIAKSMLENEIPWDVIKGFSGMKDPDICMAMMTQMGLSALLLNIRSLEQHGVFNTKEGLKALELKLDEVKYGRSIPIDFAKPYIYASSAAVKDKIIDGIVAALDVPMPYLEGMRVGVSIDISGSMNGPPLQTAGLVAIPFLKANNLWFTTFDTELYEEGAAGRSHGYYYNQSRNDSVNCPKITGRARKSQIKSLLELKVAGGTNVSASIMAAIAQNRKLDLMVLITDEQQNAGTPLVNAWKKYKQVVNPKAELWIINAQNLEWHSADFEDPSITVYQTMTPAIFRNLKYLGVDLVTSVSEYDLGKLKAVENPVEEDDA